MDLPLDNKTVWASGPPGRRAVAGRGPLATGPSGRGAAGPWRAAGRWAAGLWRAVGRGPAFSKTPEIIIVHETEEQSEHNNT